MMLARTRLGRVQDPSRVRRDALDLFGELSHRRRLVQLESSSRLFLDQFVFGLECMQRLVGGGNGRVGGGDGGGGGGGG